LREGDSRSASIAFMSGSLLPAPGRETDQDIDKTTSARVLLAAGKLGSGQSVNLS
jgi:hypothetical protein